MDKRKEIILKTPKRHVINPEREWTSRWTSRKAVRKTIEEVKRAGFRVRGKLINWGDLYVFVDYDPDVEACKAYPYFKSKPKFYRHRNRVYKLPPPDLCYTDRSLDGYLRSRIPGDHLVIDHNPGAPIYDSRNDAVPVSEMAGHRNKTRMYISCSCTPKQLADRALAKVKRLKWKEWSLFVCDVWYGQGGYLMPVNSDGFWGS